MTKPTNFEIFKNNISDDNFWIPITTSEDKAAFSFLLDSVKDSRLTGTKSEKGKALEELMTFLYQRFIYATVAYDIRTKDNQIDHEVEFPDFGMPSFIKNHVGFKLISECKNHKKSVSSQEVTILHSNLEIRNFKLGIISSYNTFSKGRNSVWENAEGKRRKLALLSKYEQIIIGFNHQDFEKILCGANFYTMVKQKYQNIRDELADDYIEDKPYPYHERLKESLKSLYDVGIIQEKELNTYLDKVSMKYGTT